VKRVQERRADRTLIPHRSGERLAYMATQSNAVAVVPIAVAATITHSESDSNCRKLPTDPLRERPARPETPGLHSTRCQTVS
jgi:hypothetical protein